MSEHSTVYCQNSQSNCVTLQCQTITLTLTHLHLVTFQDEIIKNLKKKKESGKTMFADVWMRERSRAETATVCPVSTISSVNSRSADDNISLYLCIWEETTTACRPYPLSIADLLFTQYLGI